MISVSGRNSETIPGRAPVTADDTALYLFLECGESRTHHIQESRSGEHIELLLGVVQVIDVYEGETEVLLATLDLIVQIARGQTMATRHHIVRPHDSRTVILAVEEAAIAFLGRRRSPLERYVPAFRAHDDLFARNVTARDHGPQRIADRTLGALASIVDRRVEDIHSPLERGSHGCRVARVLGVLAFPEVCAQPERRDDHPTGERAIKVIRLILGEPPSELSRALGGRASFDQGLQDFRATHCKRGYGRRSGTARCASGIGAVQLRESAVVVWFKGAPQVN